MASRGAAATAAAFFALRKAGARLSGRQGGCRVYSSSCSSLFGLHPLLDDNYNILRQERSSSTTLPVHCHARSLSSSPSTLYRLYSVDSAAPASSVSSKVILIKDDAHYSEVMADIKSKDTLAVVYFTALWCGPCRQIAPYIEQLGQQFDDVTFLKIDVDKVEVEETMKHSQIGVVPTFHFYKKGALIGELTGAAKDKLKKSVESLRASS